MSAGLIVGSAIIDKNKFYRLRCRKIKNSGSAMCFSIHFLSVLGQVYILVAILVAVIVHLVQVCFIFIFYPYYFAC